MLKHEAIQRGTRLAQTVLELRVLKNFARERQDTTVGGMYGKSGDFMSERRQRRIRRATEDADLPPTLRRQKRLEREAQESTDAEAARLQTVAAPTAAPPPQSASASASLAALEASLTSSSATDHAYVGSLEGGLRSNDAADPTTTTTTMPATRGERTMDEWIRASAPPSVMSVSVFVPPPMSVGERGMDRDDVAGANNAGRRDHAPTTSVGSASSSLDAFSWSTSGGTRSQWAVAVLLAKASADPFIRSSHSSHDDVV